MKTNSFDDLLAELADAPLAKAMTGDAPEGDEKIAAAAEEGGAELAPGEGEEDAPESEETEDDETLGKSFKVTLEDGTEAEAIDGTAMMKALAADLRTVRTEAVEHASGLEGVRGELAKSLEFSGQLLDHLRSQGELIKSLQGDLARIGGTGTGRRAVVALSEKTVGSTPAATGANGPEMMAKAMTALEQGTLGAVDIARLEARINSGQPIPADILAALA